MKRKVVMSIIILLLLIIGLYAVYVFHKIESTNEPYMSKVEQVEEFFEKNEHMLLNIANAFQGYDYKDVYIDSTKGKEQLFLKFEEMEKTEQEELVDQIWSLCENSWINLCRKQNGELFIGQDYPIYDSNCICIGVAYNYESKSWAMRYVHGYERCNHKHKIIYRLYDFIFNDKFSSFKGVSLSL